MQGFSYPAYSTVLVTEHTTVYATDAPETTSTTTDVPSNPTPLSTSVTPTTTDSPSTVTLSSTSTALQTTPPVSSATAIQPVSTAPPEAASSTPKTDDAFAYAVLAVIILLAALLIVMLAALLCLRSKGKCPNCRKMQKQLEKWESGKLKPVTPDMAKESEAHNGLSSQDNAPSELDVELGGAHEHEESKKPSTWQKVKSNILRDKKPSDTTQNPYVEPEANRPFSAAEGDTVHNYPDNLLRVSPEAPRVEYEPNTFLTVPEAYRFSGSSFYSSPTGIQRANGRESRVFAEVPVAQPKRYTADGNQEIMLAREALQSEEYKRAETIMKRGTARDSVIHRATSIVNLADQQLNVARHPSLYPEFRGSEPPEQYEMVEWRKGGTRDFV
ncbi:hypothetical protein J3E72DRAFT_239687 [Bipolaris maydis]|nr:hypothetical protein J3E74DRAFT_266177 [Bipolaris maydis]KAJ6199076.1 hypothetical protein J3E72DRAFT_239687 [Bipolaris maydis]KAJ6204983.1 hypothetical protein PSV09DRAFT_2251330 [Bipolaris maydis]